MTVTTRAVLFRTLTSVLMVGAFLSALLTLFVMAMVGLPGMSPESLNPSAILLEAWPLSFIAGAWLPWVGNGRYTRLTVLLPALHAILILSALEWWS